VTANYLSRDSENVKGQWYSLPLRFNGHFPGEPGLAVFIEAKDDGCGGDNWTTGAISRAKLQSNHHHQQTNMYFFTGRMPFLTPNQQCQSTEENKGSVIQKIKRVQYNSSKKKSLLAMKHHSVLLTERNDFCSSYSKQQCFAELSDILALPSRKHTYFVNDERIKQRWQKVILKDYGYWLADNSSNLLQTLLQW